MNANLVIKNALLIDGTGQPPQPGRDLLVRNGRIVQVGAFLPVDQWTAVLDAEGACLLPALIDCHVHLTLSGDPGDRLSDPVPETMVALRGANHLRATLDAGITTVRDLGGRGHVNILLAQAVEQGIIEGPRVLAAGRWLCMTGGHGWEIGYEVDGPEEVRKAVREEMKAGAHVIKFMATGGVLTRTDPRAAQLSIGEMRVGVEEAHRAGRRVAAHAHSAQGVKNALLAGVDTIEHGTLMDEEALGMLIERGAFYVPTLVPVVNILAGGAEAGIPDWVIEKGRSVIDEHKRNFQAAYRAGVKIAAGTDAGDPLTYHGTTARELQCMVDWGMKPMDAIVAGTRTGADLLGMLGDLGTIEPGKRADLLLVRGDPLEDITVLQRPDAIMAVVKDGNAVRGWRSARTATVPAL
jgi:imidazolonepropionase-like amidohydrolase